eukprot:Skav220962  [mRNA]  locus=scaffold1928:211860:217535:+ [translate_table: standard]
MELSLSMNEWDLHRCTDADAALSPIEEDDEQLRQLKLEEVSPAHSTRSMHGPLSGWQQQLSDRLAKEKWVVNDSIRVAAHAAIPVLSFAAAPEAVDAVRGGPLGPCNERGSTRVDICLHDSGYRGLRSKVRVKPRFARDRLVQPVLPEDQHDLHREVIVSHWEAMESHWTSMGSH